MNKMKETDKSFLIYLISIFFISIVIFFDTWLSMVDIWWRSDTFTHGFFVIPASLWLIWQNKSLHKDLHPTKPSFFGLAFLLMNGFLWLLASMTQTLVIQQFALVGMLIGSFWLYLGNNTIKKLIFPVVFLYFMVPFGEQELIPYLMEYTATFTVSLLRLSGLSVYREGLHFSLTSGNWSVVEACSGLRYLIASITLGTIYAYITYSKLYKRTLFILISILFPIIANGLRAYMIVMIGHLSDMKYATGVDHLVYGAVFFAIIIFIMFYIGSFWRDAETITNDTVSNPVPINTYTKKQSNIVLIILLFSLYFWPFSQNQLKTLYQAESNIPQLSILAWQEVNTEDWGWKPKFKGATTESLRYFKKQDRTVGLYQANFADEKQGAELVNMQNVLINSEDRKQWHFIKKSTLSLKIPGSEQIVKVDLAQLRGNGTDIITAKWYQIGNRSTNNPYLAKIFQVFKRLTLDTAPEIYFVVFTKTKANDRDYSKLNDFIAQVLIASS